MTQYKIVIFGSDWDVYRHTFHDLIANPWCLYLAPFSSIGLKGYVQRLLFNPRWSHYIPTSLKTCWNRYYTSELKEDNYCFIILENWLRMESNTRLIPYLREQFPHSYTVCYMQDLVTRIEDQYTHKVIDPKYLQNNTDLVLTYDKNDADKYNLQYAPTVYSPITDIPAQAQSACDLYFAGTAKGRLRLLADIAREMETKGIVCKFHLIGVPKKEQIKQQGIYYTSHPIPYKENLQNAASAGCLLEVLQPDANSETLRTWEAIMLNKRLLTNNPSITQAPWYNKEYISTFTTAKDIDTDFIKGGKPTWKENPYTEHIRPIQLIKTIADTLQIDIAY